jgi:hypothetical protein
MAMNEGPDGGRRTVCSMGRVGGAAGPVREPLMPQGSADQLQSIPMSPNLSQSFGRAKDFAREQNHRALLLEHLLLALTEDPEAFGVLRACNVDAVRLSTDISGYLGRLTEDMRAAPGTEPGADAELLRVIEAARQAAQQSRRKAIDGAIVLAAIVGDGKSPAAGLLKTHGMTFDEAIKTLQKASAQARTKQYSTSTVRTEPAASPVVKEAVREPTPPPAPAPAPERSGAASQPATSPGQTVDDILAAARARIQQRSTGAAPKPEPKPEVKPKAAAEAPPKPEPDRPLPSPSPFSAPSAPPSPDLPDLPPPIARPPQGAPHGAAPGALGLPPTPPGASPAPPLPPAPSLAATEPGLPPRVFQKPAGDSAPRPPLPRWPDGAARGDRADATEPTLNARPSMPNGALGGPRRPPAEAGRPPQARTGGPPVRAAGQRAAAGPLMEAIPRRMRVGATTLAQVRINRDKVEGLMQLLAAGRMPPPAADASVARVLTVRLLAPDGGFAIEAESPETQWIEASPTHEDHVGWRWAVTPLARGRRRLQLAVAARTVGRDGIGPEASPPDRIIDIAVRPNRLRRLVRWAALILLFAAGIGLGRLSHDRLAQDLADIVGLIWRNVVGLLVTSGFLAG